MRSILVFGFMATFTVAAVESLSCVQCSSPDCSDVAHNCEEEDSVSCGASSISWPEGEEQKNYYEKFCSTLPAGTPLSFAVQVTGQQQVLFSNKFCNEDEVCELTPPEDFPENVTGETECPTCLALNGTACEETNQTCNARERCIDLLAQIVIEGNTQQLELKGCSNISDAACIRLSKGNVTVGNITFQHLVCTPEPITTPDSSTTATPSTTSNSSSSSNTTGTLSTNSNSSSNTTTFPTTTSSSGLSQAAKLPWIASLVLGLLLL